MSRSKKRNQQIKTLVDLHDTTTRLKTTVLLGLLLTQQGREHDPEARNNLVRQQMAQLEILFQQQQNKGNKLAEKLKKIGTEPLAQERDKLRHLVENLETSLQAEIAQNKQLNEKYGISALLKREEEKRRSKRKTKKVFTQRLSSGKMTKQ